MLYVAALARSYGSSILICCAKKSQTGWLYRLRHKSALRPYGPLGPLASYSARRGPSDMVAPRCLIELDAPLSPRWLPEELAEQPWGGRRKRRPVALTSLRNANTNGERPVWIYLAKSVGLATSCRSS
jgi:hypothetical protein